MRSAHPLERAIGMQWYVSDADGVGGRLRDRPADFRVREREAFDVEVHPPDAERGSFPHLVCRVTLDNWDTNDFAGSLSDALGISRERISWAGTKDKRAVTTQLFSIDGIDPPLPEFQGATIEILGRAGRPVLFGDLAGNEFEVVVRDPHRPESVDQVTATLRSFAGGGDQVGVPNFFGIQRFGSRRAVTHEVGLAVIHGDWEAAVLTYVTQSSDREPDSSRRARELVAETRDWDRGLSAFPDRLGYERAMLHRLADGGSFRQALETLPVNLQHLVVNAAQSYAFNRILSARLDRRLPFDRAVEGDVVCFATGDPTETGVVVPDPDRLQRVTRDRLSAVNRHVERGRAFVTAPLIGTETDLGTDEPGDIERSVLEELGLEPDDFDLPGEFASAGTRRAILTRSSVTTTTDPLTFSFALPKGSYATVLMREYLKTDPTELG